MCQPFAMSAISHKSYASYSPMSAISRVGSHQRERWIACGGLLDHAD